MNEDVDWPPTILNSAMPAPSKLIDTNEPMRTSKFCGVVLAMIVACAPPPANAAAAAE